MIISQKLAKEKSFAYLQMLIKIEFIFKIATVLCVSLTLSMLMMNANFVLKIKDQLWKIMFV